MNEKNSYVSDHKLGENNGKYIVYTKVKNNHIFKLQTNIFSLKYLLQLLSNNGKLT